MEIGKNLNEIQTRLLNRELSVIDIVKACIRNAQDAKLLNGYVELWEEEALSMAQTLDTKIIEGASLGKLFGLVVSIKDVIAYRDHAVSAASAILDGYTSPFSATAVERILAEDAIIIGRTNCDEFAMGSSTQNSAFGGARNALDPDKVPGGSSGGSAISVSIDSCHVALGSDTGGSVRQPAAFHNLYGFKPSYGRVSRHGLIAYASSFDQIGCIAKDWETLYSVYHVMQGADEYDSTSVHEESTSADAPKDTYHVAYFSNATENKSLDPDQKALFITALDQLSQHPQITLETVDFELLDYLVPLYYILTSAEASSNLSRFDGIRYGKREPADQLEELYVRTRSNGFGPEVKRRIMLGTFVLSSGYYDAYFGKAQQLRALVRDSFERIMDAHDFVVLPISSAGPWCIGKDLSPVEIYLSDIFTVLANILGTAAVSVPYTLENGTVYNLQILSKIYCEDKLSDFVQKFIR